MTHLRTVALSAVAAVALASSLSGCSPAVVVHPEDIVGLTFAEADPLLPQDPTYLIQDASPLVGEAPRYSGLDFGSSQWVIIAACADSNELATASTIEIAVIPVDRPLISEETKDEDFAGAVSCEFGEQ